MSFLRFCLLMCNFLLYIFFCLNTQSSFVPLSQRIHLKCAALVLNLQFLCNSVAYVLYFFLCILKIVYFFMVNLRTQQKIDGYIQVSWCQNRCISSTRQFLPLFTSVLYSILKSNLCNLIPRALMLYMILEVELPNQTLTLALPLTLKINTLLTRFVNSFFACKNYKMYSKFDLT